MSMYVSSRQVLLHAYQVGGAMFHRVLTICIRQQVPCCDESRNTVDVVVCQVATHTGSICNLQGAPCYGGNRSRRRCRSGSQHTQGSGALSESHAFPRYYQNCESSYELKKMDTILFISIFNSLAPSTIIPALAHCIFTTQPLRLGGIVVSSVVRMVTAH